jgi:hypothetical protein
MHSCLSRRPDFVPLEKASRAGQSDSYWASLHLSDKSTAAERVSEAGQTQLGVGEHSTLALTRAYRRGTAHSLAAILKNAYEPPAVDGPWMSLLSENGAPSQALDRSKLTGELFPIRSMEAINAASSINALGHSADHRASRQ